MLHSRFKLVSSLTMLALMAGAHAQVANGGFETGASENDATIDGWGTVGNAFTSSTAHFSTPSEGTFQATLGTALDGQYGERAGSGTTALLAETALGLSAGSLSNVGNGRASFVSAIFQTLTLNVGDQIVLDYNFLTDQVYKANDPALSGFDTRPNASQNDFGFLSFSVGGTSSVIKLIDTFYGYSSTGPGNSDFTTGLKPTPDTDPLFSESGYLTYTFTATVAGSYRFGLGVAGGETGAVGSSASPSGLLVDNVRYVPFVNPPTSTTPAPGAMAAFGLGLLGRARRRKRA